jgi:hypothetical protein
MCARMHAAVKSSPTAKLTKLFPKYTTSDKNGLETKGLQWRREGGQGAIAPGRQREGAPKEGGKKIFLMEPVKGATEA